MTFRIHWKRESWMLAIIASMFLYASAAWQAAPDSMPVHWNLAGKVDRYGGRIEGLLLLPLIALGLHLLLLVLPKLDPSKANHPSFDETYGFVRLLTLLFLVAIYAVTQLAAFGFNVDVGLLVGLAVGGLFILLGRIMGKLRPNGFVGIRTPWTLSSHQSWKKTHRIGGWLFLFQGALMIVLGCTKSTIALWAFLITMLVSSVALVVYSYIIWRSDPHKASPFNATPVAPKDLEDLP
ncbi:SdpI family protein [Aureliella helgolandensis]|uniref:Immunity protein SdpI n=1 Tax=Aureliella helgolandensis TaxID=2527968 RepID=A0A518FZY3_9BACT|nr:SdpI family protein [Aureliella helgolandensis]QDV21918.1 Immunity protein SdpI [Aureliella helgolandensis]